MVARSVALVLVLSLVGSVASVANVATADNATVAEALFRDGKRLMKEGKFAEACPKLEESQRIDPALGTLINLAACHAAQGKTATAWAEYSQAASGAAHAGRTEYEEIAREQVAKLEPKLARLKINTSSGQPAITLDGTAIAAGVLGTPLPVDPGAHVVSATAPGRVAFTTTIEVPAASVREVTVPALAPLPPTIEPKTAPTVQAPPSRAPFFTFAAVTVVSASAGAYFGIRAFSLNRDAEAKCPSGVCREDGLDLDRRARTSATISTIAFGVTLVAAALTVWTYPRANSVSVGLAPTGLSLAGTF